MEPARQLVLGDDGNGKPAITPFDTLKAVATDFRIARSKLIASQRGTKRVCLARDELARRLRELGYTYYDIGSFLGGRTHVGVMLAVRRAEARLKEVVLAAS